MVGTSPAVSGADIDAHTVVSVGPYAFTNRRPGAHRATRSALSASPADTTVDTDARSAGIPGSVPAAPLPTADAGTA
ncbi:hypothetical protein, partial [Dactylosporangium sp. NPDC050588]|uniref:hypothetical protein n=1 Tax=Dactylosporangium sp. NPDC050588 TaxID=3157211 RepID=UPI0033DE8A30